MTPDEITKLAKSIAREQLTAALGTSVRVHPDETDEQVRERLQSQLDAMVCRARARARGAMTQGQRIADLWHCGDECACRVARVREVLGSGPSHSWATLWEGEWRYGGHWTLEETAADIADLRAHAAELGAELDEASLV